MYSIDSGAFIDAWVRKYPPDFLPSLWEEFERMIASGVARSPDEVRVELEQGGDDLHDWAVSQSGLFVPHTSEIQQRTQAIVNAHPDFLPDRSPTGVWADPYVIALAQDMDASVVTSEILAPQNARHPKIPNICESLGVRCLTPLEFFRERGLSF